MQDNVHKILLLRFSSLGDIVMATPMIRCVRKAFPLAQIDMVVRQDFEELIRYNPHLDKKIALPRGSGVKGLRDLRRALNRERYDLIYDAHRSLRTLLMMPALQAGAKAYFKKNYLRRSLALTFKLPLLKHAERMILKYIAPLEPWGVRFDGQGPELFLGDTDYSTLFAAHAIPKGLPLMAVVPSAQWPGKRWRPERFRELLERLVPALPHTFLVFGGKSDHFCQEVAGNFPAGRVINLQGKVSILEAAYLIGRCELSIANDTGLMHISDAMNVPSVVILGPTSDAMGCLPFHPQSRIVEKTLWCRPCSKNGQAPCIRGTRVCLETITPEDVERAVVKTHRLIAGGRL